MSQVSTFSLKLINYNQLNGAASGKFWAQLKTAVKLILKDNFCTLDKVNILLYLKERAKVILYLEEKLYI